MQLAADFSLSGLIKKYIEDLFDEKEVSEENREKLWTHYYNKLSGAVDIGYSPKSVYWDEPLAKALKQNIAEFSAFKETSFRKTLEDLLTTDGKLTPKSEFLKQAYKVSGDYNHRWLETEYHQTIANAQSVEKWKDFEANADLYPNLKLVTVRDARVRPEHKVLDGVIRPINDPFWDTHMPPMDWGCRCDVEQTDEEPTEVKGGIQMKLEFQNNPAKTGKIFGDTAYLKNITVTEENEARKNGGKWLKKVNMNNGDQPKLIDAKKTFEKVKKEQKGVIETQRFGKVLISKIGFEKTMNINRHSPISQIKALNQIKKLKKHLDDYKGDIILEAVNDPQKAIKKPHLIGYVKINTKNGSYEIALEKSRAIDEDYKFYYIKKVAEP